MARKVVKPDKVEKVMIERRLRRKYPQMYDEGYLKKTQKRLNKTFDKKKEIKETRLSNPSKRQLSSLSKSDYNEVMKMLNKRKK